MEPNQEIVSSASAGKTDKVGPRFGRQPFFFKSMRQYFSTSDYGLFNPIKWAVNTNILDNLKKKREDGYV